MSVKVGFTAIKFKVSCPPYCKGEIATFPNEHVAKFNKKHYSVVEVGKDPEEDDSEKDDSGTGEADEKKETVKKTSRGAKA
jgi:hypothetical protein